MDGIRWSSQASFQAAAGATEVDLSKATPVSGSYNRQDAMGLLWSLQPERSKNPDPSLFPQPPAETLTIDLVVDDATVARQLVTRRTAGSVAAVRTSLDQEGFQGVFFAPSPGTPRPAVLTLGGSEGGNGTVEMAALLASHGYPALAVAYFGSPRLPPTLARIPLEYIVKALRWLRSQPGVDGRHVFTLGVSRGSEPALLLAADDPDLVQGAVGYVPSAVLLASPDGHSPAWTLGGQPLPYTGQFGTAHPTDAPDAAIPVENIRGPVLLISGGRDRLWTSSFYADAIVGRIDASRSPYPHQHLYYPEAGHGVGIAIPYLSLGTRFSSPYGLLDLGGSRAADAAARADSWPKLLRFLASSSSI